MPSSPKARRSSFADDARFRTAGVRLGALIFTLRDRLGAQARAEGHGVTPLAYGVIGAILLASGALFALNDFVW